MDWCMCLLGGYVWCWCHGRYDQDKTKILQMKLEALSSKEIIWEQEPTWIFLASFASLLVLTFHKIKLETRNSKEILWE